MLHTLNDIIQEIDYIETYGQIKNTRFIDLSDLTNDTGNTNIHLVIVPFREQYRAELEPHQCLGNANLILNQILPEYYPDYLCKGFIDTQNEEFIVFASFYK